MREVIELKRYHSQSLSSIVAPPRPNLSSLLPSLSSLLPSLSSLLPSFPFLSPPLPHQGHLLEGGCGSVKHKHRFDVVVEELTNPVEEDQEVGVGERVPMYISRPLHCLVQPDTYVWCM